MIIANYIAYALSIIGGLNWGLVGVFDFNLVSFITGGYRTGFGIVLYILIALSAIWLIISPIINNMMLDLGCKYRKDSTTHSKINNK